MRGRLIFLLTLWAVLSCSLWGHAQVRIDDRDVWLDSGKSLQQAIIDGNFGIGSGAPGNVVGPAGATNGAVARYDGATGLLLQDTSAAQSLAMLRAWGETGYVVDADPAAGGTWSAGIEEAKNRCPSTGCIIQIRCNTTYTFAPRASWDDFSAVDLTGRHDIWIRGCGPSSKVVFSGNTGTNSAYMFLLWNGGSGANGSDRIRFSDFELKFDETCTSNCTGGVRAAIYAGGPSNDVELTRMRLIGHTAATSDATGTNQFLLWTDPDLSGSPNWVASNWRVTGNYVEAAIRGLTFSGCDSCQINSNQINLRGRPIDTTSPGNTTAISLKHGRGVSITGNSIDIRADGDSGGFLGIKGIFLDVFGTLTDPNSASTGVTITGNTFTGLRGVGIAAIDIEGYNAATIVGNSFEAGQCSASALRACSDTPDCEDVGGTCIFTDVDAITVQALAQDNQSFDRGSLIAANVFRGFDDNARCPVDFVSAGGIDPLEGTSNHVVSNVFWLADAADDGFCGDATMIAANSIGDNYVVGATTQCLAGQDTAGCGLTYTRASKMIAPSRQKLPSGAALPTSPAPVEGECFYLNTALNVTSCTAGAGSARSLCCWNGAAWAKP